MKKEDISRVMREMGSKGGKSRAKKLTPEKRSEIAKKAAAARWKKAAERPPK
jgi:hypothetical protein